MDDSGCLRVPLDLPFASLDTHGWELVEHEPFVTDDLLRPGAEVRLRFRVRITDPRGGGLVVTSSLTAIVEEKRDAFFVGRIRRLPFRKDVPILRCGESIPFRAQHVESVESEN
jgi:hypothetical protein